jgi:hypothetical protein
MLISKIELNRSKIDDEGAKIKEKTGYCKI